MALSTAGAPGDPDGGWLAFLCGENTRLTGDRHTTYPKALTTSLGFGRIFVFSSIRLVPRDFVVPPTLVSAMEDSHRLLYSPIEWDSTKAGVAGRD